MTAGLVDQLPIVRPDIIVPDAGPLIHLAQADALHLLHAIGGRVVVADMVEWQATQDVTKPGASEIASWIEAGRQPGSDAPVLIAKTEIGELFRQARNSNPALRPGMRAS